MFRMHVLSTCLCICVGCSVVFRQVALTSKCTERVCECECVCVCVCSQLGLPKPQIRQLKQQTSASPQFCGQPSSPYVLTQPPFCVSVLIPSSYKDTRPKGSGPTPMTSFHFRHLCQGRSPMRPPSEVGDIWQSLTLFKTSARSGDFSREQSGSCRPPRRHVHLFLQHPVPLTGPLCK